MEKEMLNKILDEHKEWIETEGKKGTKANLHYADLRCAHLRGVNLIGVDLREANLRYADLIGADLRETDLRGANLSGASLISTDLRGADLRYADLSGTNLRYAELRSADLSGSDLSEADLCGANLDYSAFPLWCGGLDVHIDDRQATQLLYHLVRNVLYSKNTSESLKKLCSLKSLVSQANKFHLADECGHIEEAEKSTERERGDQ